MARVKSSSVGGGTVDKAMAAAAMAASSTHGNGNGVGAVPRLRPVNWDSGVGHGREVPRYDPMGWADREVSPTSDYSGYESED